MQVCSSAERLQMKREQTEMGKEISEVAYLGRGHGAFPEAAR